MAHPPGPFGLGEVEAEAEGFSEEAMINAIAMILL